MMTALCDRVLELNDSVAAWALRTWGNASPPMARPPIFRKWRREWPSQYAAGFWPRMESIAWFSRGWLAALGYEPAGFTRTAWRTFMSNCQRASAATRDPVMDLQIPFVRLKENYPAMPGVRGWPGHYIAARPHEHRMYHSRFVHSLYAAVEFLSNKRLHRGRTRLACGSRFNNNLTHTVEQGADFPRSRERNRSWS